MVEYVKYFEEKSGRITEEFFYLFEPGDEIHYMTFITEYDQKKSNKEANRIIIQFHNEKYLEKIENTDKIIDEFKTKTKTLSSSTKFFPYTGSKISEIKVSFELEKQQDININKIKKKAREMIKINPIFSSTAYGTKKISIYLLENLEINNTETE
jgi:hypothetical protein